LCFLNKDAHDGEISVCNFSNKGTYFATGGSDRLVKLWSCDTTTGLCVVCVYVCVWKMVAGYKNKEQSDGYL